MQKRWNKYYVVCNHNFKIKNKNQGLLNFQSIKLVMHNVHFNIVALMWINSSNFTIDLILQLHKNIV